MALARTRGEGGTELRSGIVMLFVRGAPFFLFGSSISCSLYSSISLFLARSRLLVFARSVWSLISLNGPVTAVAGRVRGCCCAEKQKEERRRANEIGAAAVCRVVS